MTITTSRRNFLRRAPLAVATGLALTDQWMFAEPAQEPGADVAARAVPFQMFSAKTLDADAKVLQTKPGNNNLFDATTLPMQIVMTTETAKSAKEFEWHEGRDHIVQILEGSTLYEVGGTPKNGRMTKAGEWLASGAEGSKSILMGKGDMLVIPRGTLHKRSTEDTVTFILISTPGVVKA